MCCLSQNCTILHNSYLLYPHSFPTKSNKCQNFPLHPDRRPGLWTHLSMFLEVNLIHAYQLEFCFTVLLWICIIRKAPLHCRTFFFLQRVLQIWDATNLIENLARVCRRKGKILDPFPTMKLNLQIIVKKIIIIIYIIYMILYKYYFFQVHIQNYV